MQNFGMDFVRHKYGKERIREDLVYTCDESLEDVTVASYYSKLKSPVVLYSCVANDLFYYFNTSLESLNAANLLKIIMNFGNGLSLVESEAKSNLETLIACNPNAVIIMMGLYVPSDNFFLQRLGTLIVNRVNSVLKDVCEGYANVMYIDVSCLSFTILEGDFHPNSDGHRILKNILINLLVSMKQSIDNRPKRLNKSARENTIIANKEGVYFVDDLISVIEQSDIPKEDYVEWAVATEEVLLEKKLSDITYEKIMVLKEGFAARSIEMACQGIMVLAVERKIQNSIDIEHYTLDKNVINDKLSLLSYLVD